MSNNSYRDKPRFSRIEPGSGKIDSEAAKEFGIDGERKNVSSKKGAGKYDRMSTESQMSGVPIYTKKGNGRK